MLKSFPPLLLNHFETDALLLITNHLYRLIRPVALKDVNRAWFQHRPHDRRANMRFVPTKPHLVVVGANLVFAHLPAELNFGRR